MLEQGNSDYNLWNVVKIKTEKSKPKSIKNGNIYWVKIGKNIGCEVFGKGNDFIRPVLVIKQFNIKSSLFLGIPLSSKIKNHPFSYTFTDAKNRLQCALLNQIRVFDTRRIISRCSKIDENELKNIIKKISEILAK